MTRGSFLQLVYDAHGWNKRNAENKFLHINLYISKERLQAISKIVEKKGFSLEDKDVVEKRRLIRNLIYEMIMEVSKDGRNL